MYRDGEEEKGKENDGEREEQQGDGWWRGGYDCEWRVVDRKKRETERFLHNLQHNHPMCLRLAWQRHH